MAQTDRNQVSHAVEYALKTGYNHVDAALVYCTFRLPRLLLQHLTLRLEANEAQVGDGIAASGIARSDLWVTSKLWNADHRPEEARAAIERSISDLGVDYLDLYLIHWPVAFVPGHGSDNKLDDDITIVDTWRALESLVQANLTRHIGISNFAPADIKAILDICTICPYAHEFETHPYLQQQDFVDFHHENGIRVIAYSPLANTNPTYHSGIPALFEDPFWRDLAGQKNVTVPQAVLAWGLQRGTVVIPKSVHEAYIHENLGAVGLEFTKSELQAISRQDKKVRMNDPGKGWGVHLFKGLDDPTDFEMFNGGEL